MKVYFTGSPRALKKFGAEHRSIYEAIVQAGHTHLSDDMISKDPDSFYSSDYDRVQKHYKESMQCLREADVIVVEGSFNSMSTGYLVEKALNLGKPVILFHMPQFEPYFFTGIEDDKLQIIEYTPHSISQLIRSAFDYAENGMDARFNFFVSPKHQHYMDWISRVKRIPRAVFLRRLIEREMAADEGYQKKIGY